MLQSGSNLKMVRNLWMKQFKATFRLRVKEDITDDLTNITLFMVA